MAKRLLIVLLCMTLLCTSALAAEPVINSLKTDCSVDSSGTASVIQTFTVTFNSPSDDVRFPIGENAEKAQVMGYRASRVTQNGICYLKLRGGFSGTRTFTVNYTLKKLVSSDDEGQLFTLPLWPAQWPWAVENYSFTVTMPTEFQAKAHFSSGYDGDVVEDYLQEDLFGATYMAVLTRPMRDREAMTMTLRVADDYFSGSHQAWSAGPVASVFAVILAILAVAFWFFKLRSARISHETRTMIPDSAQSADLPYLLCSAEPDFRILLLNWANLGYISVGVNEKRHIRLYKRVEMGAERRPYEPKLFKMLFGDQTQIDCVSSRYQRTAKAAQNAITRYWERRLYEKNSPSPMIMKLLSALCGAVSLLCAMSAMLDESGWRWFLLLLSVPAGFALNYLIQQLAAAFAIGSKSKLAVSGCAVLVWLMFCGAQGAAAIMLTSLALALFTGIATMHGGKRGAVGTMLISQANGYRQYLKKASPHRLKLILQSDPQYFYRTLPDALALGLGDSFAARFDRTPMDPCDWLQIEGHTPKNAADFYSELKNDLELLQSYMK